jgi:hypothetical protein
MMCWLRRRAHRRIMRHYREWLAAMEGGANV